MVEVGKHRKSPKTASMVEVEIQILYFTYFHGGSGFKGYPLPWWK